MRARRWIAAAAAASALSGCGGGGEPATSLPDQGRGVFVANCSACHGPQGQGTDQGPPLVHVVYEPSHHPDDAFRQAIAQGAAPHHWDFGPMPPVPDLDDDEVDAAIAYVRDLQGEAGIE